ncbi:hypothetical protein ACWGE0_41515 [Lentzea sp. NPDC054927]
MKLVAQVKLLPTPDQAAALAATLHACNEAANCTSRVAFERNVKSRNELQKLCYREIKDRFGLSAQPAVRVVKKVVDAYTALHAAIRAGNFGGESPSAASRPSRSRSRFGGRRRSRSTIGASRGGWTRRGSASGRPQAG